MFKNCNYYYFLGYKFSDLFYSLICAKIVLYEIAGMIWPRDMVKDYRSKSTQ